MICIASIFVFSIFLLLYGATASIFVVLVSCSHRGKENLMHNNQHGVVVDEQEGCEIVRRNGPGLVWSACITDWPSAWHLCNSSALVSYSVSWLQAGWLLKEENTSHCVVWWCGRDDNLQSEMESGAETLIKRHALESGTAMENGITWFTALDDCAGGW